MKQQSLRFVSIAFLPLSLLLAALAPADDILIADFEGETYGDWKVEGTAFGPGPARGTLPNQMAVTGFLGQRLVNSYFQGDDAKGRLISPAFSIERRYINLLVGGGRYPGETCVNLLVGGKVVRSATGPNDQPGGSEQLEWHSWDVAEFAGQRAIVGIVDARAGGWGHINVDHIVQSDQKRQAEPQRRELTVDHRYLFLPVKTGAPKRQLRFLVDGRNVREFEIELPVDEKPDFWTFSDVNAYREQKIVLEVMLPNDSQVLQTIRQGDSVADMDPTFGPPYAEPLRPQFHFTSRRGWLNDPNGLVFLDGEYHLFYQHNPYGWNWGNMHWGHAISRDLIHWQELPTALYPQRFGDWCFSGSAIVDRQNTSGLKRGSMNPLVAAFTSTGRGESIAYSNDRGRSWTDYDGNPVVRHRGRDPKVIWHAPTQRWAMAVYDENTNAQDIAFYTSPDLKAWEFQSRIEGFFECPDLFELPVSNQSSAAGDSASQTAKSPLATKWVLYAADGRYMLGQFDGRQFVPDSGKHQLWFGNFYAAQTFSDVPDGRRIQIGWGRDITFVGMPFNQQMTIPVELTLRATQAGPRLFAEPVREIERLRGRRHSVQDLVLEPGDMPIRELQGDLYDMRVEFDIGNNSEGSFGVVVRGIPIVFDSAKRVLSCRDVVAPLEVHDGRIRLRVLVDRGSIEIFGDSGRVALSVGVAFPSDNHTVALFSRGGPTRLGSLEAFELQSAWKAE